MHKLTLLIFIFCMSGCAKIYRYEEPISGAIATVTVKTYADAINIGLVSYKGEDFLESKGDVITVLKSKAIGYSYSDNITFQVRANQEFRFSLKVGGSDFPDASTLQIHICMNHAGFIPRAGAHYLIEHKELNNECTVTLFENDVILDDKLTNYKWCLDPWLTGKGFDKGIYCSENFDFRTSLNKHLKLD